MNLGLIKLYLLGSFGLVETLLVMKTENSRHWMCII